MKVGQASARAGQELMSKPKPLPRLTWDEQYLLCRAEEARTMADEIRHPECKRIMRGIAESYEYLARQTEELRRAVGTPGFPGTQKSKAIRKSVPPKRRTGDKGP